MAAHEFLLFLSVFVRCRNFAAGGTRTREWLHKRKIVADHRSWQPLSAFVDTEPRVVRLDDRRQPL
jgi:hypothetical protein